MPGLYPPRRQLGTPSSFAAPLKNSGPQFQVRFKSRVSWGDRRGCGAPSGFLFRISVLPCGCIPALTCRLPLPPEPLAFEDGTRLKAYQGFIYKQSNWAQRLLALCLLPAEPLAPGGCVPHLGLPSSASYCPALVVGISVSFLLPALVFYSHPLQGAFGLSLFIVCEPSSTTS